MDATAQRLGGLLYRALTRMSPQLLPTGDLAQSFKTSQDGKTWTFVLNPNQKDHSGYDIDAIAVTKCLEQYRSGTPTSTLKAAFPNWVGTQTAGPLQVVIKLSKPDPYLASNLSLLRFFRTPDSQIPCTEPISSSQIITSGLYRVARKVQGTFLDLTQSLLLEPVLPLAQGRPALQILFIRDDSTRALRLLKGDADGIQNGLTLSLTRWFEQKQKSDFNTLEWPGVNVSYLGYNLKDPILKNPNVRRAIALAIDRDAIIVHKRSGYSERAVSFLSPLLPESHAIELSYNPELAKKLLDQAGYPSTPQRPSRFAVSFKTTPFKDSLEFAYLLQDMLKKINIDLQIEFVEQSVFFSAIKEGQFQLYQARWVGVSDGSILFRSMHSKQNLNRVHYNNPQVDLWLEQALQEVQPGPRKKILARVQAQMMEDLPYFPLWYWTNALVVRKGWKINPDQLSLSGALEPLTKIRYAPE